MRLFKYLVLAAFFPLFIVAGIYGFSEHKLSKVSLPPRFEFALVSDEQTIQHGKHVLRTRGCFGCHGQQLEGRVFTDQWPWVDKAVSPNLIRYANINDISTFERALRHGIGADGKAFWSMPSYNFTRLSDRDVGAIFSYLRAAEPIKKSLPSPNLGFKARWKIAIGAEQHMAEYSEKVPALKFDADKFPELAGGEYIAMTSCNECHGLDLKGEKIEEGSPPDLAIVAAYPEADFRRLMKEGIGLGGREDLGLMSVVAKDRFASFTEQELTDLYRFLASLTKSTNSQADTKRESTLIQGVNIIDGTGVATKFNQDILITEDKITQMGDSGSLRIPNNTKNLNYLGKYVIPGFVDLHVHLPGKHFPGYQLIQEKILERLTEYGITTFLNPGARPDAGVELRARISSGAVAGPRMHTAGRIIDHFPLVEEGLDIWGAGIRNEQMMIEEIRTQADEGVDFVKLYRNLPANLVKAAIGEADKFGIGVIGHMGQTTWGEAAQMGIDMLVHSGWGTPMEEIVNLEDTASASDEQWYAAYADAPNGQKFADLVKLLLKNEVTIVPTLSIHQAAGSGKDASLLPQFEVELAPDAHLPGWWSDGWQTAHPQYLPDGEEEGYLMETVLFPGMLAILKAYFESGVKIGVGTDVGNSWMTPGVVYHHELELYQQAEVPPLQILKMASLNGAGALGISDQTGSIEVNKTADLIVLNSDPIVDIRNTRDIEAVFFKGKRFISSH